MAFGIGNDFEDNLGKGLEPLEVAKPEANKPPEGDPPQGDPPNSDPPNTDTPNADPVPAELSNESVLEYLNKDRETKFAAIEDVYKTKEVEKLVEKSVNPYADVFDDEDEAYFNYKKETGRGRKDFDFLNQDILV